jgi:hypothetical protein
MLSAGSTVYQHAAGGINTAVNVYVDMTKLAKAVLGCGDPNLNRT